MGLWSRFFNLFLEPEGQRKHPGRNLGNDKAQRLKGGKIPKAGESLMASLEPLRYEAASIYDRICPTHGTELNYNFTAFKKALEQVADGSPLESAAFADALEKLPEIVDRMRALPRSDVREARMMQDFEVKAVNAFVEACKLGITWAEVRRVSPLLKSGETDEVIALKMGSSRDWVKQARKVARNSKPLEAAMFFHFTQAYEWWEAEDKVESALFFSH